jgi:hypothetical protein
MNCVVARTSCAVFITALITVARPHHPSLVHPQEWGSILRNRTMAMASGHRAAVMCPVCDETHMCRVWHAQSNPMAPRTTERSERQAMVDTDTGTIDHSLVPASPSRLAALKLPVSGEKVIGKKLNITRRILDISPAPYPSIAEVPNAMCPMTMRLQR